MTRLGRLLALVILAGCACLASGCSRFVILHDPLSAEEHNDLGVAYESAGRLDLAKREYRRAVKLKPDLAVAHMNLGNIEAMAERWPAAEKHYRRAMEHAPDDADVLNNLANALLQQRHKLEEAEALARRAVSAGGAREALYRETLEAIRAARGT